MNFSRQAIRVSLLCLTFAAALVFMSFGGAGAQTQFQIVHEFEDGAHPVQSLVSDGHGGFFGVGRDVVFRLNPPTARNPQWSALTLHTFANFAGGYSPNGLIVGPGGDIYGTTLYGGTGQSEYGLGFGVVYRLKPPAGGGSGWTEQVLYAFTGDGDGYWPRSELLAGRDGALYGTTSGGLSTAYEGTVYAMYPPGDQRGGTGPGWHKVNLYTFSASSLGIQPFGGLIMDAAGALYGTTLQGGTSWRGGGTVFKLIPRATRPWTLHVLHNFAGAPVGTPDGCEPVSTLLAGPAGSLFGTTYCGGENHNGIAFQLTPPKTPGGLWLQHVLFDFLYHPSSGVITDASGALYGTTDGASFRRGDVAYKLMPSNSKFWTPTVLHSFPREKNAPDGESLGGLIEDASGALYGTARLGGRANDGLIFKLGR